MISKALKILMVPMALMGLLASCTKDGTMVIAKLTTPVQLTANANSLDYTESDTAKTAVTFTRTSADFGYAAAIGYTLQFSVKGTDFSKVASYAMSSTTMDFTVKDFNTLTLGLKYSPGVVDTVLARVEARVADSLYSYSEVVKIALTPYAAKRVINYPFLYVPGAYQGWAPAGSVIAKLYSPNNDGQYEGFVNLPDADNQFKLTPAPTWDNSYGMLTETTMAYDGGDNFDVSGAGYYLINANTAKGSWSATLQNWSIIGDFNGWAADVPFTFDEQDQVLVKTLDLKVGGIKFRMNNGWTVAYGIQKDSNGDDLSISPIGEVPISTSNNDNIPITEAGTYKITLDLRVPDEPYCTIVKQ
jgi:hypothetical protein